MIWCGDSTAITVMAEVPAGIPRSTDSGSHDVFSSSSATQNVNLPGWPSVERSSWPGTPPRTFSRNSLMLRPIVALARLALASALWVVFMASLVRIGPFTTMKGALPPVLAVLPCSPSSGWHSALMIATTTGMYSGRHPAINAAMAIFSAVMRRRRTGSTPMVSLALRLAAARNFITPSSVGGTMGNPSVQPLRWKSSLASNASPTSSTALAMPAGLVMVQSRMVVLHFYHITPSLFRRSTSVADRFAIRAKISSLCAPGTGAGVA